MAKRHLQRIVGTRADGTPWLAKATQRIQTASVIVVNDPEWAFVLAYDAARGQLGAATKLIEHLGIF